MIEGYIERSVEFDPSVEWTNSFADERAQYSLDLSEVLHSSRIFILLQMIAADDTLSIFCFLIFKTFFLLVRIKREREVDRGK